MNWQGPTKVRFLGSGPSSGVPGIGIGWGKCNPDNPKNARTRQSILVEHAERRFLVDTTPDLRTQLLREDVNAVDAVIYTHAHADHMHGLDDLRGINKFIKSPCRFLPIRIPIDKLPSDLPMRSNHSRMMIRGTSCVRCFK